MTEKEIVALIPARGGSRRIPRKNIYPLVGKPLIAYSIEHALHTPEISRVIVSTDDAEIAAISREYGAETPFIRPSEYAQDLSTDLEVFTHALTWLQEHEGYIPDILIHLRPTHPVRQIQDISNIIQILRDNPSLHSVRSIAPAPETPYKMWFRDASGFLSPVVHSDVPDVHSMPSQALPTVYLQNAAIDAVRSTTILSEKSMAGSVVYGYMMDASFDIDDFEHLHRAEVHLLQNEGIQRRMDRPRMRTFCIDIDGVIATITENNNYNIAMPIRLIIDSINALYEQGNHIILFTARGSATGIDWSEVTRSQLHVWGVKYHELRFGKPAADYYVDDRLIDIGTLVALGREAATKEGSSTQ